MQEAKVAPRELDERWLRDLVDTAFDALVISRRGVVVFANRSFVELSGWTREEIIGRQVLEFVAPESRPFVIQQMTNPTEDRYEAKGIQRDGTRIDVEVCARPCIYDGEPARLTALRYITERKEAEEKLRRSEARLRHLIERMADMILVQRSGAIVFANTAAITYLGYDRLEDLVGKPVIDIVHPGDRSNATEWIERLSGESASPLSTVRVLRKDGSTVVVEFAGTSIDDFDGSPAVVLLGRDVADRQQMEARLVQADLLASMGTLAAGIAHEINNPLAYMTINLANITRSVRTLDQALSEELGGAVGRRFQPLLRELDELLAIQREGADRVCHIVRDFKVFARGSSSVRRPTDVQQVLESTIRIAFNDIRHRARLVRSYDPIPLVDADEPRLGQLFLNLLINALQSLDDQRVPQNEVRVATRTDAAGNAVIEIGDTGKGIPPDALGRVFEPFYSTKPIGVGTGLGLSICHSIATALGGGIGIESEVDRGTVCRISLPPATSLPVAVTEAPTRPLVRSAPNIRRSRILIVDDEPSLLQTLRQELQRDHDVTCTESGARALDLLRRESFDIVLCDLMMPSVSGMDVYETLRTEKPGLERSLIFMTAGAFTHASAEFLSTTPNLKLEKPFRWDELHDVLYELQRDRDRDSGR